MPLRNLSSLLKVGSKWGPTPTSPYFYPGISRKPYFFINKAFKTSGVREYPYGLGQIPPKSLIYKGFRGYFFMPKLQMVTV